MKFGIFIIFIYMVLSGFQWKEKPKKTASKPPFKRLDKLTTFEWWKKKPNKIINLHVERTKVIAFGIYTVSNHTLKLTAQMYPLYPDEPKEIALEIWKDNEWIEIQRQQINEIGWSATFKIEHWNVEQDTKYRLKYNKRAFYEGLIRKEPTGSTFSIASLSCNSNKDRGDRESIVKNILFQNPDLVYFSGDQSYDHREHTAAWLKFGLQFREVFRERPCITIPDDHDVGMYNLWGENGKKGKGIFAFSGGYRFHPEYVKMVERCQISHLPDPFDPSLIEQGIGVYYTRYVWGKMDFAILEDRKFKSGPHKKVKGRWIRKDYMSKKIKDPKEIDKPGLELLGKRQMLFLNQWASDSTYPFKVVLSQTPFFSGPHVHGKSMTRIQSDYDSNGWPQTGRNEALKMIKQANAIHLTGDQHIAFVTEQGVDSSYTGVIECSSPAIVNSIYARWWLPDPNAKPNQDSTEKLKWTGKYQDHFGNRFTMHAYANPDKQDQGAGYAMAIFNFQEQSVTFECWPRFCDISSGKAKQFTGWPIRFLMKN